MLSKQTWIRLFLYAPPFLFCIPFVVQGIRAKAGYIDLIPGWAVVLMVGGGLGWAWLFWTMLPLYLKIQEQRNRDSTRE